MPCQLMLGFFAYAESFDIKVEKTELEGIDFNQNSTSSFFTTQFPLPIWFQMLSGTPEKKSKKGWPLQNMQKLKEHLFLRSIKCAKVYPKIRELFHQISQWRKGRLPQWLFLDPLPLHIILYHHGQTMGTALTPPYQICK